jgi:hypothetical protein
MEQIAPAAVGAKLSRVLLQGVQYGVAFCRRCGHNCFPRSAATA